jgi:hypothetical protein
MLMLFCMLLDVCIRVTAKELVECPGPIAIAVEHGHIVILVMLLLLLVVMALWRC